MSTHQGCIRATARAGQFYPSNVLEMQAMADQYLALGKKPRHPYRAIMLPHAGWIYCGETIGRTLGHCQIPNTAIIIGPRHTPYGSNISIASHTAWNIPGAAIPIATLVVKRLTTLLPSLSCEADAHRMEHGTEVLLPFLYQMNHNIQIVPMVLGQVNYADTNVIAKALAIVVKELENTGQRPLLVISSDMNHFASEEENRRLDGLAIEAMTSGDTKKLYDTCVRNDISMCGVIPAVTIMKTLQQETSQIKPMLIDYTTSAKVSGDTSRVVGYAGVVID